MTDLLANLNDQEQIDENKNYYEELVGEGKKFKDPEALAKGKAEADLYVKRMEKQFDTLRNDYLALREQVNAGPKLQELIDQLAIKQSSSNDDTTNVNDAKEKATFDMSELKTLISEELTQAEMRKREDANFDMVKNKLIERYGNNYASILKQQIDSLDLDMKDVNEMARRQPKVLIRTLGLDAQPTREGFQTPPVSTMRKDPFAPSVVKRNEAYYEEMRKATASLLGSQTQVQMHKDAQAMGEAFFT